MQWDDNELYHYTESHTVREWGWEFIRRDSRYKDEWNKAFEKFKQTPTNQVLMPYLLAPDVSQYSSGAICGLNLVDSSDVDTFLLPSDGAMKWGLRYYQNPETEKLNPENFDFIKSHHVGSFGQEEFTATLSVAADEHILTSIIDLKKPITAQINRISEKAMELQKKLRIDNPDIVTLRSENVSFQDKKLWVVYLQCLDAKNAGIKRADAARKVFPAAAQGSVQKWDETMKQINKIAKNNYRQFMD